MLVACKKYITVNYPQTFNILLLTTQIQNSKHKNFFFFRSKSVPCRDKQKARAGGPRKALGSS